MSKVKIGAKYPAWAKITDEPEDSLPEYGGIVGEIGEAIAVSLSLTLASGQLYSDDALNIDVSEFVSGTLELETDGLDDKMASAIYGATITDGEITYNTSDVIPTGGLCYYTKMMDKSGDVYYRGHYYPKVKAQLTGGDDKTKGASISFSTEKPKFTVFQAANGVWRQTETFENEKSAKAWITSKLSASTSA